MHHSFMAEAKRTIRKALDSIGYKVYDYSSDNERYPLLKFGYSYETRYPNKTQKMKTVNITLDIWSNNKGSAEVIEIAHRVEDILDHHQGIDSNNYNVIGITVGTIEVLEEDQKVNGANMNKKLYHGVLPIEILMMEVQQDA